MKEHQEKAEVTSQSPRGQYSRVSRLEGTTAKVHPAKEARERLRLPKEETASNTVEKSVEKKPQKEHKVKKKRKVTAPEPQKVASRKQPGTNRLMTSKRVPVLRRHRLFLAICSFFLALLTVSMPYMTNLANGFQSQSLYTGYLFANGSLPYTDVFSTGGFFYYAIIALSYVLGSSVWLIFVHFVAFYMAGFYLYKIVAHMTGRRDAAVSLALIYYLLNLGLGFGGLYPIQWAMPLVLLGIWFLTKYFSGMTKDEAFILYGFVSVFAFMIEPRTAIFWVVSFVGILVYNIANHHFARGFYQLLAIIFGAILVFYTAAYFILNLQILGNYVYQAGSYLLGNFAIGSGNVFLTLVYQLFVAAASGLLIGCFALSKRSAYTARDRVIKVILLLTVALSLVMVLLVQTFQVYDLLLILPYSLVLAAVMVTNTDEVNEETMSGHESAFATYLAKHFYLPYLVVIIGILCPLISGVLQIATVKERTDLASFVAKNTSQSDAIYVWDNSATIYLASQRKAASQIILPTVNAASETNQKLLSDDLLQNNAKYVIVNNNQKLPSAVSTDLTSNYDIITVDNVSHFTVYQKKTS
ncbi:hypothetical protein [Streptococcus sp. DD12]|uniref:hypothetical protein n=1 Tax=Streptococcus sp. DD12 TaxID=1777880 RepID=UPI000791FCD2|nr:hypothetical protein [Streptococcus sp. DD12]KXT76059.1 Competence-induced protein Ccs4 [Streptococcus sp. DD12]